MFCVLCSSLNGLQAVTPVINVTCWNSQHKLLQKLVEALDTDSYLQQKLKACSVHSSLKPSQIKMLKELVLLLEPFKVTTELFQKSAETVGLVIPCIMEMRKRSSCDPILNKQAHLITTKECKVIAATLHSSLVKRMAGYLSENFHILGMTI